MEADREARRALNRLIGERIRERRKALQMSQTELGARLGLTFQQVQKYEHGTNRIAAALLSEVCDALRVNILYFLGDHAADHTAIERESYTIDRQAVDSLLRAAEQIAASLPGQPAQIPRCQDDHRQTGILP